MLEKNLIANRLNPSEPKKSVSNFRKRLVRLLTPNIGKEDILLNLPGGLAALLTRSELSNLADLPQVATFSLAWLAGIMAGTLTRALKENYQGERLRDVMGVPFFILIIREVLATVFK